MPTVYFTPPAAIAYAPARTIEASFAASGGRDPQTVITIAPIAIRPTTPSALGDQDSSTYVAISINPGTANPAGDTIEVKATVMANVDLSSIGTIDHVIFRAIAWRFDNDGAPPFHRNFRMGWKVGADTAEAAITNDDGTPPLDTKVIRRDTDGIDPGDEVGPSYFLSTAAIALQPNGSAWTQAALDALEDVAVRYDYAAGVEYAEMEVAEIWVEVYGVLGSPPILIEGPLQLGDIRRRLKLSGEGP